MEAAAATLGRTDELAARTRPGDREAFVSLYAPDFDGLFDLSLRTLREHDAACAVVVAGLERAWKAFCAEGAPYEVRSWLYALVRDVALESPPAKRRPVGANREGFDYTKVDPRRLSDSTVGFDRDLIELVWDAATTLDREEYSLLDLHVRRDLSVEEIVEHLQLPRDQVAPRLSRLCESLDDTVSSSLLAMRARHNCADLDAALSSNGASFRQALRGHVGECTECNDTKRRFASATEVLGSLAPMLPPRGLRERTAQTFLEQRRRRRRKLR
jgi:DNA-directed RNA polymerase specialized sigma24 family protein